MTTKFIGVKELRQNMSKIADEAARKNERLIVMRNNKPIFELRPIVGDDEGVYSKDFIESLDKALVEAKTGKTYTLKEVKSELGL